jgi:TP901 family phage tail tape measure protein
MDVARLRVIIEGSAEGAQQALGQAESAFDRTAGKLRSAGAGLTAGVTLPLIGVAVGVAKSFGDYERNASVFQTTTGATTREMEKMRAKAKDLGNDMRLPGTSAGDAAAAMLELAKGGLSVQQSMDGARGVLQLSAAAQIENADAATIVADALNTFALKGNDAARVSDLLAATANSSTAEITDVAQGFQMAGAVFASNKVPIEDLSVALGEMANAGVKGSDAGTSLKQMLLSLAAPNEKAAGTIKELGLEVYNADGSMKGLRDIVGQLQTKTAGLTAEQRNMAFQTIFGSDAIRAATIMTEAGVSGFDKMSKSVNKSGAAADLAAAQNKGLLGAWDALISTVQTVGITLGETFGPSITDALKTLGEWVQKAGAWFEKLPEPVKKFAGIAMVAAAALGPLLLGLAGLMSVASIIGGALGALISPVGLIVAGIAAVAVGIGVLYAKSEGFRDFISSLWDALRPGLEAAWGTMQKIIGDIRELIGSVIESIKKWAAEHKDTIDEWKVKLQEAFKEIGDIITGVMVVIEQIANAVREFWDRFGDNILDVLGAMITQAIDSLSGLIKFVSGFVDLVSGLLTLDWDKIKKGLEKIVSGFLQILFAPLKFAFGWLPGVASKAWDGIKDGAGKAVSWIKDRWDGILDFFKKLPGRVGSAVSGMWDGIKNAFKAAMNWVIKKWNGLEFTLPSFKAFGKEIGGYTIGVPDIPQLAAGGLIRGSTDGTLARLGEGGPGRDEAVLPLNVATLREIGAGIANAGGSTRPVVFSPRYDVRIDNADASSWERFKSLLDDRDRDLIQAVQAVGGM